MTTTRAKTSSVLQGYFRIERFRGTADRIAVAQLRGLARPAPQPPRPALLPMQMRGGAAQPRVEAGPRGTWDKAPRPDRLPGMGSARVGGLWRVAQPRSSSQVSTIPIPSEQLRVIGHGRPLDDAIRRTMESFFQADFSGVRVHEGPAALAMGALAFTLGEELHFAPGLYDPESREGVELLGHELTHVVQQRDGRVANPYGQGIAIVQDPALEAEADRMGQEIADRMWSGLRAGQPAIRSAPARNPVPMRRWTLQGKPDDQRILPSIPPPSLAVQRAMAFPPPDQRVSLPWDAPDLHTTLNYLEDAIREVAQAPKNAINKGKADIHFTSSIKKTSVVDTIFRCRQLAEWRGSEMTWSLAWYDPHGNQAGKNQYGPHITIRSPGQETSNGKTPDVYHHIYFKYGETAEIK